MVTLQLKLGDDSHRMINIDLGYITAAVNVLSLMCNVAVNFTIHSSRIFLESIYNIQELSMNEVHTWVGIFQVK